MAEEDILVRIGDMCYHVLEGDSCFCCLVMRYDDLWRIVKKKTVFSQEILNEMLHEKGELHVIIFRLISYMEKKISFEKIKKINSFKNKIQTVTELKEKDYLDLKNEGYFDKRYIIN